MTEKQKNLMRRANIYRTHAFAVGSERLHKKADECIHELERSCEAEATQESDR